MSDESLDAMHGVVVDRRPFGSAFEGRMGTYYVRSSETGEVLAFDYTDIVTEGFRTIRVGEKVRFFRRVGAAERALFVVRLEEREPQEFYR